MPSSCCDQMESALEREVVVNTPIHSITDGRILNDIQTEYFLRGGSDARYNYLGINYCPFCGRAISLGLWAAEKKK